LVGAIAFTSAGLMIPGLSCAGLSCAETCINANMMTTDKLQILFTIVSFLPLESDGLRMYAFAEMTAICTSHARRGKMVCGQDSDSPSCEQGLP
jgi:hypothetical protein